MLDDVLEIAWDDLSHHEEHDADLLDTPVRSLERGCKRVMRVTIEELELAPAVYLREGTKLDKLRKILNYRRRIFLGDGNAAPAPPRVVGCDLDVGDAKRIALRARQIASRCLMKLVKTGLMEHPRSEWLSPFVIVLKKNGEEIRKYVLIIGILIS
ncbi:hypothetical protein PHMEG_00013174 [Phytophthora megakarya]|uniref:Reverse transcriptase n=1 Tax=Phytophthora megakarya TaxID=4795 RepID=A0A225W910_9STRA|nr:hypothetical protein PHMEG_00013174 [Phytophthora megakarya]